MAFTDFDQIQFKPLGPCGDWRIETPSNFRFQWMRTFFNKNTVTAIALNVFPDGRWAGNSYLYGWIETTQRQITEHSQIKWW